MKKLLLLLIVCFISTHAMEEKKPEQSYVPHYFELPAWSDTPAKKPGELCLPELMPYAKDSKEESLYLRKLQLLNNFIYMHHASLPFVDELLAYETEALKTAASTPFDRFTIETTSDDKDYLEGKAQKAGLSYNKYLQNGRENGDPVRLYTQEGKEAALKLIPLSKSFRFDKGKDRDYVERTFARYDNHENSEVGIVVQKVRNSFYNNLTHRRVCSFVGNFLFSLQMINAENLLDIKERISEEESKAFMADYSFEEIGQFLANSSMSEVVTHAMPQILWLYSFIDALKDYYDVQHDNPHKVLTIEENAHFCEELAKARKIIGSAHRDYNVLYTTIFAEQKRVMENYPGKKRGEAIKRFKSIILNRNHNEFGERMPDELPDLLCDSEDTNDTTKSSNQQKKKRPQKSKKSK